MTQQQPRIIALLSWYDEDPAWLKRALLALQPIGIHHLVALDGAYALFPNGQPRSSPAEYEAIRASANQLGCSLTIYTPQTTWQNNETEKRSRLFELAEQVARPHQDWYLVIDADEFVTHVPDDLHERLRTSVFDVASVTFSEPHATGKRRNYELPIIFRAIPGIRVEGNHFTYVTPDGRKLWGNALTDNLAPRLDLRDLVLDHLTEYRHQDRRAAADTYYKARDFKGTEKGQCYKCGKGAVCQVPYKWREVQDEYGDIGYTAKWVEACTEHAADLDHRNAAVLRAWGFDPDNLKLRHAIGPPPPPMREPAQLEAA